MIASIRLRLPQEAPKETKPKESPPAAPVPAQEEKAAPAPANPTAQQPVVTDRTASLVPAAKSLMPAASIEKYLGILQREVAIQVSKDRQAQPLDADFFLHQQIDQTLEGLDYHFRTERKAKSAFVRGMRHAGVEMGQDFLNSNFGCRFGRPLLEITAGKESAKSSPENGNWLEISLFKANFNPERACCLELNWRPLTEMSPIQLEMTPLDDRFLRIDQKIFETRDSVIDFTLSHEFNWYPASGKPYGFTENRDGWIYWIALELKF